ncbi:MAG: pyridoxamine 5'-phosphate oxidase family protein [Proteobacteria bacterium]|nr:pyridoxamine 5'-phosphate oxidase family protein [Pseudomonadota bacterium]
MADHTITTVEQLEAIYGHASGPAVIKELDYISDHYRRFIEVSPFVVLATAGPAGEGLDCSPRGDPAGFVRVADKKTVMIPDRRGNNRVDSLRNILSDGRVALLFLIPGIGGTLRINGRATLSTDPALCESFTMEGKLPRCVIVVTADRVYTQCPKALVRSDLWNPANHVPKSALPTGGEIMEAITKGALNGKEYDAAYPARIKATIY